MGRKSLESKGIVTRDILYDGYVNRSLTVRDHAHELGISVGAYRKYMKQFGIPSRSKGKRVSKVVPS